MSKYNHLCMSCKNSCKQYSFAKIIECEKYFYNGSFCKYVKENIKYLSKSDKRKINKLVHYCANYSKDYEICLPLDAACYMINKCTINSEICKYFKNAILRIDKELEWLLLAKNYNLKACTICGNKLQVRGRQKYCCENCRLVGSRNMEKLKKRRQRENKK